MPTFPSFPFFFFGYHFPLLSFPFTFAFTLHNRQADFGTHSSSRSIWQSNYWNAFLDLNSNKIRVMSRIWESFRNIEKRLRLLNEECLAFFKSDIVSWEIHARISKQALKIAFLIDFSRHLFCQLFFIQMRFLVFIHPLFGRFYMQWPQSNERNKLTEDGAIRFRLLHSMNST